jgi:(1->4)-alpha-D-glucan 1-alpha-D-glucosylmutase
VLQQALRSARRSLRGDAREALTALRPVLLQERGGARALDVTMSWQQLTGAVAAKGLEDGALYDHPVLTSRNEVGAAPGLPPGDVRSFHEGNRARSATRPLSLSASSTHDSKRSEDARARIDVVSELPAAWRRTVARTERLAGPLTSHVEGERIPETGVLLSLLQDVIGAWPLGDGRDAKEFPDRIERFAIKAAREAKVHTSWIDPDPAYEEALAAFVRRLFGDEGTPVRAELERFRLRVDVAGCVNSLAQVVLKVAAPGVPDLYQGTERWFLRLVDPDNREPVDLGDGRDELGALPEAGAPPRAIAGLLRSWRDGRIKLHVTRSALRARRRHAELFEGGSYAPLLARGDRADHVVAFARRLGGRWAIAAAPRLTARLAPSGGFPLGPRVWGTDALTLPRAAPSAWMDVLTGREVPADDGAIPLGALFVSLPVALLVPSDMEHIA